MKLLTFKKGGVFSFNGTPVGQAGVLLGTNDILDLSSARCFSSLACWIPNSVRGILEAGEEGLEIVARVVREVEDASDSERDDLRQQGVLLPIESTTLLAPVPQPSLILSIGLNYGKHLEEMGTPKPSQPSAFIKTSTAVIGPGAPIILPTQCPDMVDFEGEFSLIMGRTCHNVAAKDAMTYVAGYTIANDVSARNWAGKTKTAKAPMDAVHAWGMNIMGKQLPTFCPMGPYLVTRDDIVDPHNLNLTTTLNGTVMQSSNTQDLIFQIPDLIVYFSKWYQFRPGDVITTGSPSGVGFGRDPKIFMKPGDVIAIEVEGLGRLSNHVHATDDKLTRKRSKSSKQL
jgi:acylpyruvate hydrolase